MIPPATIRKTSLLLPLVFLAATAWAAAPAVKIQSVGAISINPSHEAKVLADWYALFGLETKEMYGGYYGELETAAGPLVFGIHPKKKDAPAKSSASVAIVLRVENFAEALAALQARGLSPESTEQDEMGHFAHFHDPDGNKVSIWGK